MSIDDRCEKSFNEGFNEGVKHAEKYENQIKLLKQALEDIAIAKNTNPFLHAKATLKRLKYLQEK